MTWATLCEFEELKEGAGKFVSIDGFELAVFLNDNQPHVIDNTCPHAGGNLAAGHVEEGCAVCPWHYWMFELHTGQLRGAPGVMVHRYESRVHEFNGKKLVQAHLPKF